jgi:hypothetical protein
MVAMIATNSQLDFEHFERLQIFVRRAPTIRAQGEDTHLLDPSEPLGHSRKLLVQLLA